MSAHETHIFIPVHKTHRPMPAQVIRTVRISTRVHEVRKGRSRFAMKQMQGASRSGKARAVVRARGGESAMSHRTKAEREKKGEDKKREEKRRKK